MVLTCGTTVSRALPGCAGLRAAIRVVPFPDRAHVEVFVGSEIRRRGFPEEERSGKYSDREGYDFESYRITLGERIGFSR